MLDDGLPFRWKVNRYHVKADGPVVRIGAANEKPGCSNQAIALCGSNDTIGVFSRFVGS